MAAVPPAPPAAPSAATPAVLSTRVVARTVLVIAGVVLALYLIYLLRGPLGMVAIAGFLAVALSGPVNRLGRHIPRGLAIGAVFLSLLAVPALLAAAVVPPVVSQTDKFVNDLPRYARESQNYVQRNPRLRKIEHNYQIVEKLQKEAEKAPSRIGDAAGILRDVGFGLVNSVFKLVTIVVLAAFMLAAGPGWIEMALGLVPPERAKRMERVIHNIAAAVGAYVAGALCVAAIAGMTAFIVLTILGVPFAPALGVLAGTFSLIPLIGATIAAVIIGVVTLFNDFPTTTIIWAVWAIVYQQFENYVIQPQIQKRTVKVQPFVVLVAVLFGSTLLGVLGAIIAIPVAASIQVALREYWDWRREQLIARPSDVALVAAGGAVSEPVLPPPPAPPAGQ